VAFAGNFAFGTVRNGWIGRIQAANRTLWPTSVCDSTSQKLLRLVPYGKGSMACFWCGCLPYVTNYDTTDRIGLNDPWIARNAPRDTNRGLALQLFGGAMPSPEYKIAYQHWLPLHPDFIFTHLDPTALASGVVRSSYSTEDELLMHDSRVIDGYVWLRDLGGVVLASRSIAPPSCIKSYMSAPVPACSLAELAP
jgi:hypothetical protein